jgi:hypothetical protein
MGSVQGGPYKSVGPCSKTAAKFENLTNDSNWETLTKVRKIARINAVNKVYSGEPDWKAIGDRLQRPYYLVRVDGDWKIRNGRQCTHIGKYSFVRRSIQLWNKLLMDTLWTFPYKPRTSRYRVSKVMGEVK